MTFLSIGFLACGLAAIIPVFIHMIHRQNLRELPFASLRFIRLSEQKTRNKRRIQDLLLMLMRMAVLLLIALGLANPTIRNLSNLWGGAQTSAMIILDNSASMGTIDGNCARMDTALAMAERILDQLGGGDNIGVIVPCGESFPENGQLFTSQEKVRKVLRDTKVSFEKANLAVAVQQARAMLVKANTPSKLIFVVSDQQETSWHGLSVQKKSDAEADVNVDANVGGATVPKPAESLDQTMAEVAVDSQAEGRSTVQSGGEQLSAAERKEMLQIPIILVNCNQTPKPNVGLARLDMKNVLPIAQVPVPMTVYLKNESKLEQTRRIDVYLNGIKQYSSTDIKLEPEGQEGHPFTVVFDRGGLHKGEIRLTGNDGNPLDDKLYFAMEVDQGIPVAVVKPMRHEIPFLEETYYIEKALQTGAGGVSPIRLTMINKEDLLSEPLQNYVAVIAVNLPVPEKETAERLVQYVRRGGNLIWTCGDNVYAEDYNRLNMEFNGQLLPAPLLAMQAPDAEAGKDAWNIDAIDGSYPAFRNLTSPRELYNRVLVYRRIPVDVSQGGVPTLASLDDGMPLIVQRRVVGDEASRAAGGTVTFIGTGVHVSWSNLPIRPIFVPMINQMIFQLAGVEQTRLQAVAGQPLLFSFKEDNRPASVEIVPPSGAVLRRELKKNSDGSPGSNFVFEDTHQIGVYQLRPIGTARQTTIPFSVNLDGDEIDPVSLTEESGKERFGATPFVFTQAGDDIDSTFDKLKRGTSLWDMVLWIVLIVLIFEAFVSNWWSQRKEDQQKGVDVRQLLPRKAPSLG